MAKRNKYIDKYQYKNHIQQCPNCGGNLKETDHDCPYCGVNLVGYNEKHNMADNMSNYAKEISDIADKNNALNEKIRKDNEKTQNQKKKLTHEQLFKKMMIVVFAIFGIMCLISLIFHIVSSIGSQSYEEVEAYFNTYDPETIKVDELDYVFESNKEQTETGLNSELTLQTGYDKSTGITILREIYKDDYEFSILRIYEKDIASLPRTNLYDDSVTYSCGLSYIDVSDSFEKFENNITTDEYILQYYIDNSKNYVKKLPTLNVEGTKVFLYYIGTAIGSDRPEYVVGIVPIEDDILFVSRIIVYDTEVGGNPVLNNLEKYFYIVEE